MDAFLALIGILFLVSLVIEIARLLLKGMIYLFKVGFLVAILISAIMGLSTMTGFNTGGLGDVCKRIDGCPIINGICVGCE